MCVIYKTSNDVEILVEPGDKSKNDFRVRYQEPGKRKRTPKHIHLIIDLYMKKENNKRKTMELVDQLLESEYSPG